MGTHKALGWTVAVVGLWEIAAPFVLGYSATSSAVWNAVVLGVVLMIVGAWAALTSNGALARAIDWTGVVAGCWSILAPFTIGYSSVGSALWNDVLVGLLVLVLSGWAVRVVGSQKAGARSR